MCVTLHNEITHIPPFPPLSVRAASGADSPMMARYLTFLESRAPFAHHEKAHPDENFAREIMQAHLYATSMLWPRASLVTIATCSSSPHHQKRFGYVVLGRPPPRK